MEPRKASLPTILAAIQPGMIVSSVPEVEITGITIDSRKANPGDLFVAMRGSSADGHSYIQQALERGAAAVAGERPAPPGLDRYVQFSDTRQALSWIAAAFYGWPARKLRVIGITGTDGKTTTATLIHQILSAAHLRAGLISTVSAVIDGQELDTGFHVTTPDAHDVQRYLASMVEAGLTHVVLETTSHGWSQHRVDACEFDIGVVTNITHEHLDEHGSYAAYRAAKARLFLSLEDTKAKSGGNPRLAVLNRDDESYDYLAEIAKVNQLSYGVGSKADLRATQVELTSLGSKFLAESGSLRIAISTSMPGVYNVSNCLAAVGATAIGLGIPPETVSAGILRTTGVPGRMERIDVGQTFTAIVDFAHTPNALSVTLEAARSLLAGSRTGSRVIAVFGSAGLRDRAKRRMMAEIAIRLADLSIFTAEDPRTESLDGILQEMATSARSLGGREGETFWRIPDRGAAIRFAVEMARSGDIVIACGKGHEKSMCFGTVEHAWDDRTAMRAALAQLMGLPGPAMPYLPTRDRAEIEWLRS